MMMTASSNRRVFYFYYFCLFFFTLIFSCFFFLKKKAGVLGGNRKRKMKKNFQGFLGSRFQGDSLEIQCFNCLESWNLWLDTEKFGQWSRIRRSTGDVKTGKRVFDWRFVFQLFSVRTSNCLWFSDPNIDWVFFLPVRNSNVIIKTVFQGY